MFSTEFEFNLQNNAGALDGPRFSTKKESRVTHQDNSSLMYESVQAMEQITELTHHLRMFRDKMCHHSSDRSRGRWGLDSSQPYPGHSRFQMRGLLETWQRSAT